MGSDCMKIVVSSSQTYYPGWRLSIRGYKRPLRKSDEMPIPEPIPFLSEKSPTLASENWCLIVSQEVMILEWQVIAMN